MGGFFIPWQIAAAAAVVGRLPAECLEVVAVAVVVEREDDAGGGGGRGRVQGVQLGVGVVVQAR